MYSAAGTGESWDAKSPKWVDLATGFRYWIAVTNPDDTTEVNTGVLTIEVADADPDDMCRPDTFAPLMVGPDCSGPIGAQPEEARIDLADHPIAPRQCCTFAFPCPKRFMRVVGAPGTVDVTIGIVGLKRTGMGPTDPTQWPFGFQQMPPELYSAPAPISTPAPGQTRAPTPAPRPGPAPRPRAEAAE